MITLDKISIEKFREQGVREVFVHLIKKGCEGTKIEVLTEVPTDVLVTRFETPELTIACLASESEKLEGARLTQVGSKWIFTSKQVTGRCGCGSSFRFAGDPTKTPKEFLSISLLEAGTSHTLNQGDYFVYGKGITEITVTGEVRIYSLELSESSEIILRMGDLNSRAELRSVVVGGSSTTQSYTSLGEVSGINNRYHHNSLILVAEGAQVSAKISANVEPKSVDYDVDIHESALMLGTTGKVRGIPELKVASEDGKASHSATMERLSGDILVYLASRGISLNQAQKMYLSSRISSTYAGLHETTLKFLEKQIFKTLGI